MPRLTFVTYPQILCKNANRAFTVKPIVRSGSNVILFKIQVVSTSHARPVPNNGNQRQGRMRHSHYIICNCYLRHTMRIGENVP